MAPAGPQLPAAQLEKRKRSDSEDDDGDGSSSDSHVGPAPPKPTHSEGAVPKKPRVIGPSLPLASTDARPSDRSPARSSEGSESSDDDGDGFGPSLPPTNPAITPHVTPSTADGLQTHSASTSAARVKRDDWMMVPPTGGDWTGRVDPTKLKNRKFNTGKGVKGPSSTGGSATDAWHETPQEKQARLQREMMGIKDTPTPANAPLRSDGDHVDTETAERLREYNKSRGPTLYDSHQKGQKVEKDDDPSARAFDREKDIGGGLQINATQRRDMMKKASDFGSRFSGAKYL